MLKDFVTFLLIALVGGIVGCERSATQADAEQIAAAQRAIYQSCINASFLDNANLGRRLTTRETVSWLYQVNTADCPSEFRGVYQRHIVAWEDFSKIEAAKGALDSDENVGFTIAASILATLVESDASPFMDYLSATRELARVQEINRMQINDTFRSLQEIAIKYGVTPPSK